jgi:hypothetical protein
MSGYDEEAYRRARESAIALSCPFERALLSRCVTCFKCQRLLLAEREAIACTERAANDTCKAFHAALHENARFALHLDSHQPWPFGKEIRAQCGGVLGLQTTLGQADAPADVAMLVSEGLQRYTKIEQFPYSEIMRGVVHFEPRRRKR